MGVLSGSTSGACEMLPVALGQVRCDLMLLARWVVVMVGIPEECNMANASA